MEEIISYIVKLVDTLGLPGIFIMTFLESTFIPIPSEVTMIPAGYLVSKGEMNFIAVLVTSILGTIGGALFNYWIAFHYGRWLFVRCGKYFFMDQRKLKKIEDYFESHGPISTFIGRLIPGIRHYISFPAGLGKMKLSLFTLYTALGGSIWMLTLLLVGYFIGENEESIKDYLVIIKAGLLVAILTIIVIYVWKKKAGNGKTIGDDNI